jgi:predicted dehydrogenase
LDKVRVGLVGVGFMGWIHQLAYRRSQNAALVAFASRDSKKRSGDWRGIQGNFGPPGEQIDISNLQAYESYEEMIRSPSIDVVDICLPPHLHTSAAIQALEHGKDVFIEKPMALQATDCERIVQAARDNNRLVMVAHVLPYMGAFEYATRIAAQGSYGPLLGGHFKRVISDPSWLPDFYDPEKVGGPLVDLHVHDLHWIQLLFGNPVEIQVAGRTKGLVAKFVHCLFRFENPQIAVSSLSGVVDAPGRPFTHGFELHFERAIMQHDFAAYQDRGETWPLTIATLDGQVDAFCAEINDMAMSVRSRQIAPRLDGQLAANAVELALRIQSRLIKPESAAR